MERIMAVLVMLMPMGLTKSTSQSCVCERAFLQQTITFPTSLLLLFVHAYTNTLFCSTVLLLNRVFLGMRKVTVRTW